MESLLRRRPWRRRSVWGRAAAGCCCWLGIAALWAVQTRVFAIEELARHADWVVRGRVLEKRCQADDAGRVFTRVRLALLDCWKGRPGAAQIEVVQGGGILGERKSLVPDQAPLDLGEEVVLFLVLNARGEPVIVSLDQGKFRVWRDERGGPARAASRYHNGATFGAAARMRPAAVALSSGIALEELERQVRGAAGGTQ